MKNKNKNKDRKEINYEHIKNLASALKDCGYKVDIWWDANWYCTDQKTHHGIELVVENICDGDDTPYSFIFNSNGQKIDTCLEGELKI